MGDTTKGRYGMLRVVCQACGRNRAVAGTRNRANSDESSVCGVAEAERCSGEYLGM